MSDGDTVPVAETNVGTGRLLTLDENVDVCFLNVAGDALVKREDVRPRLRFVLWVRRANDRKSW